MSNPADTVTTNIVPVQGIFKPEPTFELITFIGPAGTPFLAPVNPNLDGVTITNSTINSSVIGGVVPAAGTFTNISTVTGQISTLPTNNNDIANKQYVDSVAQGLSVKTACVYATTGNITLSGLGTQAGGDWPSSLSAGDRILVKNQTTQSQNGIYVASSSGWSRSSDMNVWAEVPSAFTFVQQGTTLADTGWVCTSNAGGTIDVTPIVWAQFSGAGSYLAGNGLQLTGNTFSVLPNGSTINVSSSGVKISDTYAGQSSITTVGTLTAGTWNAGTIQAPYGGTGFSSYTTGDLLYASSSTALSKLADVATGNVLLSGGVGVAPSYGKVGLTTHVSDILPIANGGTNNNATPTAGAVAYGTGTAYAFTATGTAGYVLTSSGSGAPTWTAGATSVGQPGYWGSFWDTTTQSPAAINTAYSVAINSSDPLNNGISVSSGSRITFSRSGVYSITFSLQFVNTDTQIHDANVWLRKNDSGSTGDVPDSDSKFSVPAKHGGINGNLVGTVNFVLSLSAGDYIELIWSANDLAISLATLAAGTTPVSPQTPSVIVTATAVAPIGLGYGGLTSSSTVTPGTGNKTFTTNLSATDVAFTVGTAVRIAYVSDPTQFMQGVITSYGGTTMVVNCEAFSGSTPQSNWTISVAGSSGVTTFSGGATGLTPSSAAYGAVTLGGTLGAGYGGTGKSTYVTGDILYASNSSTLASLGIGSNATILTSSGTAPQWSTPSAVSVGTATNLAGGGAGFVPYQSSAGATSFVSAGSAGQVLTSNGTSAPTWTTPTAYATVTDDTTTNAVRYPLFANQTTGNLTTEFTASTKYQFNPATGTLTATSFSGAGTGLTGTASGLSIGGNAANVTGIVATTNGGTGLSSFTANGVVYASSSSALTTGSALTFDGTALGLNNNGYVTFGGALALYGDTDQTVIRGRAANGILFQNSSATEIGRWTSSGNLGIGTSSPQDKLHVAATGTNAGTGYLVSRFMDSTSAKGVFLGYDTDELAGTIYGVNFLTFQTYNGSAWGERMRLDASGNLGIGTSSPNAGYKLDVAGKIRIAPSSGDAELAVRSPSGSSNYVYWSEAGVADRWVVGCSNGSGDLAFRSGGYTMATGTEHMRLDSSGNLGIGTSSPGSRLDVSGVISLQGTTLPSAGTARIFSRSSDSGFYLQSAAGGTTYLLDGSQNTMAGFGSSTIFFATGNTERARIDSSGNLGLGVTPSAWSSFSAMQLGPLGGLSLAGALDNSFIASNAYYGSGSFRYAAAGYTATVYRQVAGAHTWSTTGTTTGSAGGAISFTQAMTLDVNGNLLVGTTSGAYHNFAKNNSGNYMGRFENTASSDPYGLVLSYPNNTPNSVANEFLYCVDNTGLKASIRSNGGLANYSGNNVNLSDRREKTNFAPAKSYLNTICAIPVQTFNYIDQSEDDPGLTLGVVAQDVQTVAPELVMESNWGTKDDPKMRLSIYQTDLQYALMKCIQELKAELDTVKAELSTLKGN